MAVSIINSVAAALKNSSIALLVALLFIYGATYREMETENDYETRDSRGVQQRNEISVLSSLYRGLFSVSFARQNLRRNLAKDLSGDILMRRGICRESED